MDDILIVPYDERWRDLFAREIATINAVAPPGLLLRGEHFGSTAVPGLAAKPVIDILLGVASLADAKDRLIPAVEPLGYSYWRDDPNPAKLYAVKGLPPNSPRTHHLHIVEPDSQMWEQLLFRDYLRLHNDEAARYAALKHDLAARFRTDREAYTEGKSAYIAEVMKSARRFFVPGV
ncbi:MAG: GrpB family protein [Armatimonadetes bacterium]|nr:GrpB family protein [Armatimonadota bacterium]